MAPTDERTTKPDQGKYAQPTPGFVVQILEGSGPKDRRDMRRFHPLILLGNQKNSGGSMKALLTSLLTSDAFLYRKIHTE